MYLHVYVHLCLHLICIERYAYAHELTPIARSSLPDPKLVHFSGPSHLRGLFECSYSTFAGFRSDSDSFDVWCLFLPIPSPVEQKLAKTHNISSETCQLWSSKNRELRLVHDWVPVVVDTTIAREAANLNPLIFYNWTGPGPLCQLR